MQKNDKHLVTLPMNKLICKNGTPLHDNSLKAACTRLVTCKITSFCGITNTVN